MGTPDSSTELRQQGADLEGAGSDRRPLPSEPARRRSSRSWRATWTRVSEPALPAVGAAAAIAAWWLATIVFNIRPVILPSPPQIVEAFLRLPEHLLQRGWETLWATLVGFTIAAAGGVMVAVILTVSERVKRAVMPLVVVVNSVPKVAVVPLLIFWLGRGYEPKIFLVILICFFPVVVSTMSGLTSTPADLGELTRSMTASGWQSFVKVRFPWALPQVFVGLKVAMPLAMIGAVVAEISNPNSGLGSVIVRSGASLDTPLAFAAIVLLAILSVTLFYLVVAVERLLLPWVRAISA